MDSIFKLLIFWVGCFSIGLIIGDYFRDYDDTDDELNKERSGLVLYTDHLTGCQYIKGGMFSSLEKRVDGGGRHVGCR